MPTPKELSDRFIRAYNERDRVAIRACSRLFSNTFGPVEGS